MKKIKSKFTISPPKKPLSPRTYLGQCSEWDSCSNQEGGLVQPFFLGLQDILLLPRDWDADMTNSLTTTASKETIVLSCPTF